MIGGFNANLFVEAQLYMASGNMQVTSAIVISEGFKEEGGGEARHLAFQRAPRQENLSPCTFPIAVTEARRFNAKT